MTEKIDAYSSAYEFYNVYIRQPFNKITTIALRAIGELGKFLQEISANSAAVVDSKNTPPPEKKKEEIKLPEKKWGGYLENLYYNLIGENFCASWDLPEAIRDLLQNAMDSMLEIHRAANPQCKSNCSHWISIEKPPHFWQENQEWVIPFYLYQGSQRTSDACGYICWKPGKSNQGPTLTVINKGAKFGREALTVGCTTKKHNSQDAGGHGEGLKAIISTACRKDLHLEIYQSGAAIQFHKNSPILLVSVKDPKHQELRFRDLTEEYCKRLNVSPDKDVIVHLGSGKNLHLQQVKEAAEKFLSLTHRQVEVLPPKDSVQDFKPVVVTSTTEKIGNMLVRRGLLRGPDLAQKVYVRGILFNADAKDQTAWGVDLAREDARNRDRAYVFPQEYSWAVGKIISGFIDNSSDTEFVKTILKEFVFAARTSHCSEHLTALAQTATEKTRQILRKVFKAENPDAKYLIPGLLFQQYEKNDLTPRWCDLKICRIVHPILYQLLQQGEYPSVEKIREECSQNLKKAPVSKDDTEKLRQWIREHQKFIFSSQTLNFDEKYLQQIEVRATNAPDVPLFIVIPGKPLPKIVFSQCSMQLNDSESQMQFLTLVKEAFDKGYKKDEKKPPVTQPAKPMPEKKQEQPESQPPARKEDKPASPAPDNSKSSYVLKKGRSYRKAGSERRYICHRQ